MPETYPRFTLVNVATKEVLTDLTEEQVVDQAIHGDEMKECFYSLSIDETMLITSPETYVAHDFGNGAFRVDGPTCQMIIRTR